MKKVEEYPGFTLREIEELTKVAYLAFVKHQHRHPPLEDDEAEEMWRNLPLVDICRYGRWDFREAVRAVLLKSREMLLQRMAAKGLSGTEQGAFDCTSRELDELAAAAATAHYVERCANDCAYTDWRPVAQAVLRKRKEQLLLRQALGGGTGELEFVLRVSGIANAYPRLRAQLDKALEACKWIEAARRLDVARIRIWDRFAPESYLRCKAKEHQARVRAERLAREALEEAERDG